MSECSLIHHHPLQHLLWLQETIVPRCHSRTLAAPCCQALPHATPNTVCFHEGYPVTPLDMAVPQFLFSGIVCHKPAPAHNRNASDRVTSNGRTSKAPKKFLSCWFQNMDRIWWKNGTFWHTQIGKYTNLGDWGGFSLLGTHCPLAFFVR